MSTWSQGESSITAIGSGGTASISRPTRGMSDGWRLVGPIASCFEYTRRTSWIDEVTTITPTLTDMDMSAPAAPSILVLKPPKGLARVNLAEVWASRELLFFLV